MPIRRARTIVLVFLVSLLLVPAVLYVWLDRHPEFLLAMVNRQLPPGVVLHQVHALQVSAIGGELGSLSAGWDGNTLEMQALSWRWRIESWWPFTLAPQSLAIGELVFQLAPASDASTAATPLPRLWQNSWWPRTTVMDLRTAHLVLNDADGERLLEGRIELEKGATRGNARLLLPGMPFVSLAWQPDSTVGWRVDLRSEAPLAASGTAAVTATGSGADWRVDLGAPAITLWDQRLRDIAISASGSSDLFDARAPLATVSLQASGILDTPRGTMDWQCAARIELAQTWQSRATLDACSGRFGEIAYSLSAPVSAQLDANFTAQAVAVAAGSLQIGAIHAADWTIDTMQADIAPARVWSGADTPWTLPPVQFATHITNPVLGGSTAIDARLDGATWQQGKWIASLSATLRGEFRQQHLAPMELTLGMRGDSTEIGTRGQLATRDVGRLAEFSATYLLAKGTTQARASLDTASWTWGDGLLATVFGARQTVFDGDLLGADLRAEVRLDLKPGHSRLRAKGEVKRLYALAAGIGVAGMDSTPFSIELRDARIHAFDPLELRIDSVNTGLTLNRLHARLEHAANGWWLRAPGGELLGGTFAATDLGPLGTDPLIATITATGIELQRIAALLDNPDLTLSGTVGGRIPLRLEGGTVTVQDGHAASEGAGVIRYRPAPASAAEPAELALARKALSNLQFETLDAALDYAADGTLVLRTRMEGRNPDLDSKRPVHLNLTVDTNLRTLLQSLRAGDRVTAWLEKRSAAKQH